MFGLFLNLLLQLLFLKSMHGCLLKPRTKNEDLIFTAQRTVRKEFGCLIGYYRYGCKKTGNVEKQTSKLVTQREQETTENWFPSLRPLFDDEESENPPGEGIWSVHSCCDTSVLFDQIYHSSKKNQKNLNWFLVKTTKYCFPADSVEETTKKMEGIPREPLTLT